MIEILLLILFSLALATLLAALAAWRGALTRGGLALAWALCAVIVFFGGLAAYFALGATFVFTILAGALSGGVGREIGAALHAKTGRRDAVQIFCNVALGALMLALRGLTGLEVFLWAYGGAMAASLADSMASELGVLSKRPPRDICTFKPCPKGLSGGVTALGLLCSFVGAAIIGGICSVGYGMGLYMFIPVTLAGFIAALCDSVMGSLLQAKYLCPVCGQVTEKPLHCGVRGGLARGLAAVNNDTVNFLNNCVGAAVAAAGCLLMTL